MLAETGRVEVVGYTTVPEDAVKALSENEVDVCFLDIQMPRLNGFEVLAALPKQPIVVFTTAYDQYALKAFDVNSVDYLLKPIDREHLDRALDKLETRAFGRQNLEAVLQQLVASVQSAKTQFAERIASRLGDRIWFIDVPRITHFFAEDKLTYAAADGKNYTIDQSIQEIEGRLDPARFLRIHRSTIVNTAWIKEVSSLPGGNLQVQLRDTKGTELVVARDRAREFKRKLGF